VATLSDDRASAASRVPRRADGFVARDIGGELVIVPVRSQVANLDSAFTLNEVGATIWRMLDGRTSLAKVAAAVAGEYEVSEAAAADDVAEFVELLLSKKLLEMERGSG
jgi:hypothetical protein